jgi:methyl-accepting chemotaxis protein
MVTNVLNAFPRLRGLPEEEWLPRHRAIVTILWLNVLAIMPYSLIQGYGVLHALADALPVAILAVLASMPQWSRGTRSSIAALGLVMASAVIVHIAGGAIAAHFHFFVVLPIIGLYLDWRPFALAVAFIVVHHFGFALISPHDVYDTAGSWNEILGRTAVHAAFVVVEVLALLASWKLAEQQEARLDARNTELDASVSERDATVATMAAMSDRVREGAVTVAESADALLDTTARNAASAAQHEAALGDTAGAVIDVREAADRTAREARDVVAATAEALTMAARGQQAMAEVSARMDETRARVTTLATDISALSQRVHAIRELTATVDELADRSNLLALNASIEAARAGEHGKGFAVVAQAVRDLAEQSRAATAHTEAILGEVDAASAAAVRAAEEGAEVVEEGVALAAQASEVIADLAGANDGYARRAEEIAAAADQQRADMEQIANAMSGAAEATSDVVASAREAEDVAQRLRELAAGLDELTAGRAG